MRTCEDSEADGSIFFGLEDYLPLKIHYSTCGLVLDALLELAHVLQNAGVTSRCASGQPPFLAAILGDLPGATRDGNWDGTRAERRWPLLLLDDMPVLVRALLLIRSTIIQTAARYSGLRTRCHDKKSRIKSSVDKSGLRSIETKTESSQMLQGMVTEYRMPNGWLEYGVYGPSESHSVISKRRIWGHETLSVRVSPPGSP